MLSVASACWKHVHTEPDSSIAPVRARIIAATGGKCGLGASVRHVPPEHLPVVIETSYRQAPQF